MSGKTLLQSDIFSAKLSVPLAGDEVVAADDPVAIAHEERVRVELNAQFRTLKRQAHGIFEAVKGRIGARNEEYLEQVFAKAQEDYETGKFLVQRLGADRQLDLPLVATLTQIREDILKDIQSPGAAERMLADSAIIAYRNMLRVQGWLGSLCLEIERGLFGQDCHSPADLGEIEAIMERMEVKLLPILDRCQRMLLRAIDSLESRKRSSHSQYSH